MLVTGGSRGIGAPAVRPIAGAGARVGVHCGRDLDRAKSLASEVGGGAQAFRAELAEPKACQDLWATATACFGRIDVLVNNAAAQTTNEDIADLEEADIVGAFEANVFAMFHLTRAAVPHMAPGASIVNTGSVQSKVATPTMLIYAATKGAINSLTVGLSNLLAPQGIRVNCVAPGPVWTPIQPIAKDEAQLAELGKNTPLGRAGQPAELAGAFVLLASEEGSYMSGAVLAVTGGMPML